MFEGINQFWNILNSMPKTPDHEILRLYCHPQSQLRLGFGLDWGLTIDKILFKHVVIPHVLDFFFHLVNFFDWMSQGGHSEQTLLFALFYQSTPSCLKVRGGVGGPFDFSVSPRSKSFFFSFFGGLLFNLGVSMDRGLDLDQGLTIRCHY